MPSKPSGKAASKAKRSGAPHQSPPPPAPNWPPLRPLVPASDLTLETLLEDQVVVIRNLCTPTLCKQYVSFLSSLPLVTTPAKPKDGEALRVNDRIQLDDPKFAEQLWTSTALHTLMQRDSEDSNNQKASDARPNNGWGGEMLGLNPRIRIYRYREGQFFAQHYDESNVLSFPSDPPRPAKTTWTLLIYLTGPSTGCIGGETVFYPELGPAKIFSGKSKEDVKPLVVELEVGMALLHKHGQDCLLHEGNTVTKGEKWVIRSDLCVQR